MVVLYFNTQFFTELGLCMYLPIDACAVIHPHTIQCMGIAISANEVLNIVFTHTFINSGHVY